MRFQKCDRDFKPTLIYDKIELPMIHFKSVLPIVVFATMLGTVYADEQSSPSAPNPFQDKVILVYLDRTGAVPAQALEKVSLQAVNGEIFLTGTGADTQRPKDWRKGTHVAVRWGAITSYVEFSKDEFEAYCKAANSKTTVNNSLPPAGTIVPTGF